MMTVPRFIVPFVIAIFLSACIFPGTPPIPTPYPPDYLPTIVVLTGQAAYATAFEITQQQLPTSTSESAETIVPSISPTPAPTQTPTPEPGFSEFAQIRFLSPGPMSKIVSPLQLQMLVVSGESEIVQIDLLGEDGRKLTGVTLRVDRNSLGAYRTLKIPFEIRAVAELGWLQVSTRDRDGRIQALNSLPVLLLSAGVNEINPPGNIIYEHVVLENPREGAEITGGILDVKGRYWPAEAQPLFLELILPGGKVVAARVVEFDGLEPQFLETTIPYKLPNPENGVPSIQARLTIRQDDPTLNIPIFVYTRAVMLYP